MTLNLTHRRVTKLARDIGDAYQRLELVIELLGRGA